MEFITTIALKRTNVYHLHRYKADTESLIFPSCPRLPHKNSVIPLFMLRLQYEPSKNLMNAQFCILMAVCSWCSKH